MANGRDWGYKVVREIRLYVEGGGDGKDQKARIREGFSIFLNELRTLARSRRINWQVVACGSRNHTYRNFQTALETHSDAFNVLVVDGEGPVQNAPWEHLYHQDNWHSQGATDEQCHLMIQTMEAWLVADLAALRRFYGRGFNANSIPNNPNVEDIPKRTIESALKRATKNTTKGEYHKLKHGPAILARLEVARVRAAATHFNRLFVTLA
jgi:hypothetical protein